MTDAPRDCFVTFDSVVCAIRRDAVGIRRLVDARERSTEDVCDDVRLKYCSCLLIPPKTIPSPKSRRILARIPPIRVVFRIVICRCTNKIMQDISCTKLLRVIRLRCK